MALLRIAALYKIEDKIHVHGIPEAMEQILAKKPRMLVAIALANKVARGIWAMIMKKEEFRGGPSTV